MALLTQKYAVGIEIQGIKGSLMAFFEFYVRFFDVKLAVNQYLTGASSSLFLLSILIACSVV